MNNTQPQATSFQKELFYLTAVIGIAFIVMLPIFWFGVPIGNDLRQHLRFAETFHASILNGEFFPSWTLSENFGFGGLGTRFYPPLVELSLALAQIFTNDWHLSVWLIGFLLMSLSGLGVYGWARELFVPRYALLAAACYVLLPYHVNQYYNATMFGEFAGAAFLPFCFWFVLRICRYDKLFDIVALSVAYALLILSHLPLTIISSFCLLLYSVAILPKDNYFRKLAKLAVAVFFSLIATAFFWWKVVTEMAWLKQNDNQVETQFHFSSNFLFNSINDFLSFGTFGSALDPLKRFAWFNNFMLVSLLIALLPLVFVFWRKQFKDVRQKFFGVTAVFAFSVFMTTPASYLLWDNLKFLQQTQFPWRWLLIISLFGSLLLALSIQVFTQKDFETRGFLPQMAHYSIFLPLTYTIVLVIGTTLYIPPNKVEFARQNYLAEAGLRYWWPVWVPDVVLSEKEKISVTNRNTEIRLWQPDNREFTVSAGESNEVRVATFYYPYWQATVNDIPIEIKPDQDGMISIPVPAKEANVKLHFVEPFGVNAAFVISGLMWIFLLALGFKTARAKLRNRQLTSNVRPITSEPVSTAEV